MITPARTGSDNRSRKLVMSTDHTNNGSLNISIPGPRIFKIVVIKLMVPARLEIPAMWRLKIAISTAIPKTLSGG